MSSSNKHVALKKMPPLPSGWVAYPSKSYSNRVYYYNVITGYSSWDEPKLRQHPESVYEQHGKKLTDLVSESFTSSVKMASHKPCELTQTSALDNRLRSNTSYSSVLSLKSHGMTLARSKKYERHGMEHDPTFPHVKDCKRINNKLNTKEKMSVGNKMSSFDGAECKYHNSHGICEEAVCRKRRMKQKFSRSYSAIERPPSKQIKLCHDAGCQNSNDSIKQVLHNNKKNSQVVLPSTLRASRSSTSGSSEIHLQKDDTRHIPQAKTQNKISLEHAAVNTGLHNTKRKCDLQDCDSGLAARRLKALRTTLAKEFVNTRTSGGQESEEPLQKIWKSSNPSRSSSGCSEIGIPVHSRQTSRKESSFLKNDCSTVTDDRKWEGTVPDPCQRTYLKKGQESEEPLQKIWKSSNPSRSSSGCSEIGIPVHSRQTSRKESSFLKNDCSTVTDDRKWEGTVPDPCQRTYLKKGQESEEPLQKIWKSSNPSRSSSGCSEIGIPVHSRQTSRKESSFLKNDCSTVTDDRKWEGTVPDPCQRTYLKKGQESEEPLQKIWKSSNPSRSSSGCSEIGIPVHSRQTSRKESSFLKNDCSTVTDDRKWEGTVPDPCQRTYLKKGFEKCNATKRLGALQKKLAVEHDRDCKELSVQKGNSLLKTQYVPESCARGDRSLPAYVSTSGSKVNDKESFQHNMKQNLSEQCPDLTGHVTTDEDELMEWEPIEDEKILSHIQEVRIQIQHDDKGIQRLNYGGSPIFSASGKQEWFIVLDSNVLLSNIKYIEELRDTNVKGLGFPVLVIPWQVLQELDILKDQRKVKSHLLAARARRAISFLHSNFTSKHPRVRGQTALDALDAISKDFKIQVPDDSILHCCLQIAQRTNQVILLSNDKNLCNKAIVNGIRAYKMAEIQQELQAWGMECSSGNVVMDVIPVDKAVSLADSIHCRLKLLLKELLSRVLEIEMIKVYDTSWKRIVVIKPPWTLSDILICMCKHWIAVFAFVMPAEAKPILESLNGFFGNITQSKGYGHSLPDVKAILQQSLHLCMLIRSEDYRELVSRCVTDIKVLQKHCEEALSALTKKSEEEKYKSHVKNKAQHEDIQSVTDVLKECWNSVHFFCAVMCDVLGFEHHMVYNRPQIFPTPDAVQEKLPYYCHSIHALIKSIMRIRELPMSVLTVDHEAVKHFFLTLTNFLPSEEVEEKINPELILKFCTTESTRSILETAQAVFQEMGVILDRGRNYFVQCGTSSYL